MVNPSNGTAENGPRAPDFFLVGAPKSATSSLHVLLRRHPDIFMCRPKEPHFFSTDLPGLAEVPDRAAYDALFAAAPGHAKRGEASAFYLLSQTAARNIRDANPRARIIISIRNPADAAVSLYHQLRDGFREDQTTFEAAWRLQEARGRGERLPPYCPEPAQLQYRQVYSYPDQISRYLEVFGPEAVKIVRFEEIRTEPARVVEEVLVFLGVPPFERQIELSHANTRREPRLRALSNLMASPPRLLKPLIGPIKYSLNRLGIKPSVIMMKYMSRPADTSGKSINPDFRREVLDSFAEDIDRLETLLQQDFSAWRR